MIRGTYSTYATYNMNVVPIVLMILISLMNTYITYFIFTACFAIINWYESAFGDSDEEDLNENADPGDIMEGGRGEVPNEAGTYNMSYPFHVSYL